MNSRALLRLLPVLIAAPAAAADDTRDQVLGAMAKATAFMMNTVSDRGGFVWHYSSDLSRRWGEVPARPSQIWVQPPSTPTVGTMLVDAWLITRDPAYLEYAGRVAGALIWGQLPSGGWHYFIDFDPAGVRAWNAEVPSRFRGWEEFYHYYGNGTFDDDTTASAARFLLRLYHATLDPKYKPALDQALAFVTKSQYPNGAWPQRFPLSREYSHEGRPDYSSFYTFNDGVIANNISLLLEGYERLADERLLRAARRGMDFFLVSQLPEPQAGWAQQYDHDLKPAWARSYEPAAVCSAQTVENIHSLQDFYAITGDRKYLRPIPSALDWLRRSALSQPGKGGTHSLFYELGTNAALYAHHHVRDGKIERYTVSREPAILRSHAATQKVDVAALEREFQAVAARSPEEARSGYLARQAAADPLTRPVPIEMVREITGALDSRGAWPTDIEFIDTDNYVDNPPLRFRGIDTRTYVNNMYRLLAYLKRQGSRR